MCPEKCHELIRTTVTFISPIKISAVAVFKFYTKHSLEWPSRKLTFKENIHQENASIDFGVYLSNYFWNIKVESRIVWGMKFCDMPYSHKWFKFKSDFDKFKMSNVGVVYYLSGYTRLYVMINSSQFTAQSLRWFGSYFLRFCRGNLILIFLTIYWVQYWLQSFKE